MAIPFRTLRFPERDRQRWGLNIVRVLPRRNEIAVWSPVPRQFGERKVSYAGLLEGIDRARAGRSLRVKPALVGWNPENAALSSAGSVVAFEVSDTGPGISEKARAHLFEAFQGSTRSGGTGLGLAIAAELVQAHGGEIRLIEGTIGATFRIAIPDGAVSLDSRRDHRASA